MKTIALIITLLFVTSSNKKTEKIPFEKKRPTIEQIIEVKENHLLRLNSEIKVKLAEF